MARSGRHTVRLVSFTLGVALILSSARAAEAADPIGYAAIPKPPSSGARKAFDAAAALESRNDLTKARAGYERALSLWPTFAGARFALGRTLARAGLLTEAAQAIAPLLVEDPPRFRELLASDPALAALRGSPEGSELESKAMAAWMAWREAIQKGVPVVARLEGVLRPGVLTAAGRFVPAAPPVEDTLAAIYFVGATTAVSVAGHAEGDHFRDARVVTFPSLVQGAAPAVTPLDASSKQLAAVWVSSNGTGAIVTLLDRAHGTRYADWKNVDRQGRLVPPSSLRKAGGILVVSPTGAMLMAPPEDAFRVEEKRVWFDGGPSAPLSPPPSPPKDGLPSLSLAPDGKHALAVWTWATCEKARRGTGHAAFLVDVAAHKATPLSSGPGAAAATFAPDGTLYLQTGDKLRRFPPPLSPSRHPTPIADLLLTPPQSPPICR